jgi:hypothetical protein
MKSCTLACAILMATALCFAQKSPSGKVDNEFVQKQFGASCSLVGALPLVGDLNSDGVEDIVIPGRCTNPLEDQVEFNYKVSDPYNSFFGFGDPKITTGFASEDPELRGIALLIIHGSGPDAWRAASPRAKFLIINLPYRQLSVKKMTVKKKKPVMAVFVQESGGDRGISAMYFDGKKYKYTPLGSTLDGD